MDLHGQIMNLQTPEILSFGRNDGPLYAYKVGHRDALHAAAELVLKVDAMVDAARAVLSFRVDTPTRGDLRDNASSRAALRTLAAAVASIGDV